MKSPAAWAAAGGFTYIGLLIAVAVAGVGLAVTGEVWRTAVQREKERELLFIGDEIRRAITQYYDSTPVAGMQPGAGKQFPKKLDDLLRDARYLTTRRYLRKVYRDPMTGSRDWGIVKGPGDGIMGVYSRSTQAPLKRANFPAEYGAFEKAESYAGWQFAYSEPPAAGAGPRPLEASAPAPGLPQPMASPIPASAVVGQPSFAAPAPGSPGTVERK